MTKYKARRRALEYEKSLTEWWKKNKTFEQSIEMRSEDKSYVFYDGPPFITGNPHHGTLLSSIVKDAVPRFWTMRGYRVERRWGWDCHGLPAENFVEKQLNITDRREIGTSISLETYITKARESMVANSETWESTIDRVGRWVDFKGAYRTMNKEFMESVWWAFKKLYEAGKIYEGRKVLMYDTKFATPVSKAEVTMDNDAYQVVTDPSAYVRFEISTEDSNHVFLDTLEAARPGLWSKKTGLQSSVSILAWTTTPWTLPANLALAVNPEMEYGFYEMTDGKIFIVAKKAADRVFSDLEKQPKLIKGLMGDKLVGLKYKPNILDLGGGLRADGSGLIEHKNGDFGNAYKVWGANFVSSDDGTGIVHIAPAYGEDDYQLSIQNGIPCEDILDENGYYEQDVLEALYKLGVHDTDEHGVEIWAGNKFIAKCLEEKGIVYKIEYIKHEYPFNPRSKQRIMYRAFPSWFFDVQGQKEMMLSENENINWFPGYLKHGRFAKNIEQAPDWNLSRDRFWATAMPVWRGDKGTVKVVGSYDELYELSGKRLEDYHRPWVDEIEFDIDGEHFTRVDKVLDCWFESGSMPFAQLHYPFENKEKFERNYPADFIVEYVGQVRAWFYYVHTVNTALAEVGAFGSAAKKGAKNAYKNVITTGTLAGNDGRKMSKSLGNYTDPNELMDKFSADSLRFLLLSSPVLSGEDFALLDKDVSDTARKLSMIWNVYDFFSTYANVDGYNSNELLNRIPSDTLEAARPSLWSEGIDSQSSSTTRRTEKDLQDSSAPNPLDVWIVSRVHQVRNEITEGMEEYNLPKALAPVLPFIDDLSNWFVRRSRRRFWKSEDDNDKNEAYDTLAYVLIYLSKILAPFVPFLAEELYQNMTQSEESVHLLDWPKAGEIDDSVIAEMSRTRQIISEGLQLRMQKSESEDQIKVRQPLASLTYDGEKLEEVYEKMIADEVNVKKVVHGKKLALDKNLTDELKAEGFARELIRVIQAARKKAGLNVDDRIRLRIGCDLSDEYLDMVKVEVLATEISAEGNYTYDEIVKVEGQEFAISLEKA